ncbi:MAG TPA: 7TM diverse intracellular signaling domain-containing protein [Oligoflexus sp.]|uniref:7TM diverse intracellular signaling domain-containing protein n=1 Tax=Oligoflexus sp. TaxID=1971216 RepID=UPI002D688367|nr:7TM diverse intracellular signaling domain-containing protein [Oligoflexus sp.]HYX35203.1 7TM diverse intracellular signaling domain-containing protein [Oligoflexus sp.]
MRFGWLILVHSLVLLLARPAQAQQEMKVYTLAEQENGSELAPFIYSYEDKFSKRTLSQLTQPQFKRFKLNKKRSITFSYSSSAFWLRFAVANPSEVDRNIAIKVDYPLLDEISFFDAGRNGYEETVSGDSEPYSTRWLKSRNFAFPATIAAGETKIFYVRVKSSSTVTLPLQIWDAETLKEHASDEGPAFGLYFGCMIAILLYNAFIYVSTRSRTYLSYVCFLLASIFFYLSWTGVGTMFFWGDNQWMIQRGWPVAGGMVGAFSISFLHLFLDLDTKMPKLARVNRVLMYLSAVMGFANMVLPLGLAYKIGFSCGAFGSFYAFGVAGYMTVKGNRQAVFYIIAWSVFLAAIALSALSVMGVLSLPMVIGSYGSQIGSALEAILLSLGLADRINVMKKKELEQSNHIIEGLSKIRLLKNRLETVLTATKQMSEHLEKTHALQAASIHIQKELSNLETRHVWFLEQDENTGDVRRLVLSDDQGEHATWEMEWLDARECMRNKREIIVPAIWKGMRFGVFCIGVADENTPLPIEDINFLETMMQSLALSLQNIDYQNNLKDMVDARTSELNLALGSLTDRQRKIDDILLNIEQGIFTFDENFHIGEEYSQHLLEIFKIQKGDMSKLTINDILFKNTDMSLDKQNTVIESLKSSVDVEAFLWDANTHHLPHEIVKLYPSGPRNIELEWKPLVSVDDHVDQVMVVAKDVTDRRALQRRLEEEEVQKKRFIQILTRMVSIDKNILDGYFAEVQKDISHIKDEIQGHFNDTLVFRMLHTMKGLSRSLKFDQLSAIIHECEGVIVEPAHNIQQKMEHFIPKFTEMEHCFGEYMRVYDQVFGMHVTDLHNWNLMQFLAQVLPERLDAIRNQNYPIGAISCNDRVMNWNIEVVSDLREILLHLFNNSLDHGFLLPFGHQLAKKPIQIDLSARVVEHDVEITLEDYGAGIDIEKLVAKAKSRGIAFDPRDPYELIFHDGLSTAQKATMTSGRGVGLAAVRSRVADLGGTISYGSIDHVGTKFVIRVPLAIAVVEPDSMQKVS